jgi:ABC-type multidrug transport system fused ATPase/permease subunit
MIATIRSLTRLLERSHRWIAVSAAIAGLQAALLIPVGLILQRCFDTTIPDGDVDQLVVYGALLLALFLGSTALGLWTRWLVLAATKDAIAHLRIALLERLRLLPTAWFDAQPPGRVQSIVVQDSERVDIMANAAVGQALPAAIICVALTVALLVVDPLLLAVLAITWPLMFFASRLLGPPLRRRTRAWQEAFDRFSSRAHFAIRGRTLIAAHDAEDRERREGDEEVRALSDRGLEMAWLQSLYGQLNGALAAASAVVVLVVGGAAVARGDASLGSLISFYALLGLLRTQAVALVSAAPHVISGGESLARLAEILEAPDRPVYEGTRRLDFDGAIELRDVRFGYGSAPVLERVSIAADPGEWIALRGANGAGKSTVASLAAGLYRPWAGVVFADGVPYDELDLRCVRRRLAVVSQDPVLIGGTVAANIAFGLERVDAGEVREAIALAGCADVLATLPGGLESQVGDEGELLSGGQRQAIALARATLRHPALLILDEPSTSLDRVALPHVLDALRGLPWSPTTLLISHEPEVIARADRLYELRDGVSTLVSAGSVVRS